MRPYILIFVLIAFGVACNNPGRSSEATEEVSESRVDELKEQVINRHDTAMARMNEIARLQRELREFESSADSAAVMETYGQLQSARDAMMDWMRQFGISVDSSEEAQLRYLKGEYDRIKEVDENMLTAIARAEELLTARDSI